MIKSILVCTDGSAYGDTACEYAIHITQRLKAQLAGLHVLDSRMLEGPMLSDISGMLGAQPFSTQLQQFRELMEEKGESVLQALAERGERDGLDIETRARMGHPARIILEEEVGEELLILGQKGEHAELIGDLLGSNVERIVRRSSKPCLVTPVEFQPITKILAAFDGSSVAGKALHEGIELAQALNVPLLILTVRAPSSNQSAEDIAETGIKLARAHNCAAARLVVEGRPSEQILEVAHHHGCNLIVLGAYGHSLIREWIIGSTTAHLIHQTDLPVMLVR
ncbi:MAG: universal stress protein [Verrucomicrobia bacterium]|nr:MAG: universal stress protein [Verrucomicrobiota bacterium]